MTLKLPNATGSVTLVGAKPYPRKPLAPDIMGPFALLPEAAMECSHGVVSMDHTLDGRVAIDGSEVAESPCVHSYLHVVTNQSVGTAALNVFLD